MSLSGSRSQAWDENLDVREMSMRTKWNPWKHNEIHISLSLPPTLAMWGQAEGAGKFYHRDSHASDLELREAEAGELWEPGEESWGPAAAHAYKISQWFRDNACKLQQCLASIINLENVIAATSPLSLRFRANIFVSYANLELCKKGTFEKCNSILAKL